MSGRGRGRLSASDGRRAEPKGTVRVTDLERLPAIEVAPTSAGGAVADTSTRAHWWILVVIAGAQLMVVLDTTIMIIALPSAQQSLGFSNADRQWVVTAYTLGFGGFLLLGGRISDMVGPKRTLIIGVVGFAAGLRPRRRRPRPPAC